jgi:transcriptional regulator GlxA family with amidase domain
MGMTAVEWLHAERLALSQRLLESSDHSVEAIAALAVDVKLLVAYES